MQDGFFSGGANPPRGFPRILQSGQNGNSAGKWELQERLKLLEVMPRVVKDEYEGSPMLDRKRAFWRGRGGGQPGDCARGLHARGSFLRRCFRGRGLSLGGFEFRRFRGGLPHGENLFGTRKARSPVRGSLRDGHGRHARLRRRALRRRHTLRRSLRPWFF